MTASDIIATSAALIAVCALIISYLSYQRDRNKSNQDFIFQEKVTAYKELIFHANNIFESFFYIVDGVIEHEGSKKEWTKYFDKECEQYDELVSDYYAAIFKSIPVIPSEIYAELIAFGQESMKFVDSGFKKNTDLTIKAHQKLETSLKKIIKLVREDLNVEKLNVNLSNRLK